MSFIEEDMLQNKELHKCMLDFVYEQRNEDMPVNLPSIWFCFKHDDRYKEMLHRNVTLGQLRLLFVNVILKNVSDYIDDDDKSLPYFVSLFDDLAPANLQLPSLSSSLKIIDSAQMQTKIQRAKVLNLKKPSDHISSCHLSWSHNLSSPDERQRGILLSKPEIRKRILECRAKKRTYFKVNASNPKHAKEILINYKKAIKRHSKQCPGAPKRRTTDRSSTSSTLGELVISDSSSADNFGYRADTIPVSRSARLHEMAEAQSSVDGFHNVLPSTPTPSSSRFEFAVPSSFNEFQNVVSSTPLMREPIPRSHEPLSQPGRRSSIDVDED